jgi:hypothetical protein
LKGIDRERMQRAGVVQRAGLDTMLDERSGAMVDAKIVTQRT